MLRSYIRKALADTGRNLYIPCRNHHEMAVDAKPLQLLLKDEKSKDKKAPYKFTGRRLEEIFVRQNNERPSESSLSWDDLFKESQGPYYDRESASGARIEASSAVAPVQVGMNIDAKSSATTGFSNLKYKDMDKSKLDKVIRELAENWRIDTEHSLWSNFPDKTVPCEIFFISAVIFLNAKVRLSSKELASFCLGISFKEFFKVLVEAFKERAKGLTIHEGDTIAYQVTKITVNLADGSFKFHPDTLSLLGIDELPIINAEQEIKNCRKYCSGYFKELSCDEREALRKAIENLLPTANSESLEDSAELENVDVSRLELLRRMVADSLPTAGNSKKTETDNMLRELGVSEVLSGRKGDVLYGIQYVLTALSHLPPEALPWLKDCASSKTNQEVSRAVKELERVLHCMADQSEYSVHDAAPKVLTFLALALLGGDEWFLDAWRDAYVSTIFLCGFCAVLPVSA